MSDLDTLIVTFQTQLSDVMETVVKTAMYEVTRLVEDGLLEEVRRRRQEAMALRTQLQWAERRLSDQVETDGRKRGRCVSCDRDDVEASPKCTEETAGEKDDITRSCNVKKEADSAESWTHICGQESISESAQGADEPSATLSPERESQAVEEENVMLAVDVKEEVSQPYCSIVCLGSWSIADNCEAASESHNCSEMSDAQPIHTQENNEELLRNLTKNAEHANIQSPAAYVFPEDQEDTHMVTDPSHVSPLKVDTDWAGLTIGTVGLLQNHTLGTNEDAAETRGPTNCPELELSESVKDEVLAPQGADQISRSPLAREQNSNVLSVAIKQEVVVDSDGDDEEGRMEEKTRTKTRGTSFSRSAKQLTSQVNKQNHTSHKATVQGIMKLHSKVGASLKLQAAVQHHRPIRRPPHTLSNSSIVAPSVAHPQVGNLNPLNRIPSTSKAVPPSVLPVQRDHPRDKAASALSRTGAPWVSIKAHHQSANSQQAQPQLHPDSLPHSGARHLLRCGHCERCFPHPSNLKAHLQTHTGERPFCCSLCGRSFTKLSNLKAHRRVHTGERPYSCSACGKRFTQKCNLKRHQRIHLDG
ncbi:uncharacterized protein LOC142996796 [Genypterus blacodes]|uniref:uncharacterized protein LOC142996796 n=1 Tax=Genypterus blacodes TaxID=154954 RepID=UPI003F75D434